MNAPEELRSKIVAAEEQIEKVLAELKEYLGSGYVVELDTGFITHRSGNDPIEQMWTKCQVTVTYMGVGK